MELIAVGKIVAVGIAEISGVRDVYVNSVGKKLYMGMKKFWYKKNYAFTGCLDAGYPNAQWKKSWNIW